MRVLLCVLLPALLAVATADYAWDVYSDANAVYGSIDSSLVTTHPNFLGKFQSPELCAAACLNKFGCLGFTFHQPDFEKPLWATTCYMLSGYQFIVNRMVPESKVQSWIRKERKTESGVLFDKYQDMSGSYAGDQYTAAQLAENPNGEKFYGTFESGAACARACAKDRSCAGVTWFGPQDPSLHKSCVAIASSSWIPTHQQGGSELWVKSSATPAEASKPHHHRQRPAVPPPEDKWGSYRRYRLKQQLEEDRKDHQAAETELRFASTWATQECDVTREEWKLRVDRAEDSLSAWKEVLESRKHLLHHHQSHVAGYHDHSKYINEGPASRIAFMKSCRHGDCAAKWCTAHPDECDDWHEALEDWKISHNDWQQYNHDHVVARRQKWWMRQRRRSKKLLLLLTRPRKIAHAQRPSVALWSRIPTNHFMSTQRTPRNARRTPSLRWITCSSNAQRGRRSTTCITLLCATNFLGHITPGLASRAVNTTEASGSSTIALLIAILTDSDATNSRRRVSLV